MNQMVTREEYKPLQATDVLDQANVIKQIMSKAMLPDVHYGTIPGTQSPTLYKAGADMLLSAFHIATEPEVEDLSTDDEIRYRIRVRGVTMGSGSLVGVGIGECSSMETKYKWRRATRAEYDATSANRRRIHYVPKDKRQPNGPCWENHQVRQEPIDVANTVLKMAKKRASVDLCHTVLACSDVFDRPEPQDPGPQTLADEPRNDWPQEPDLPPDFDDIPSAPGQPGATHQERADSADVAGEPIGKVDINNPPNLGEVRTAFDKSGCRDQDLFRELGITSWQEIGANKPMLVRAWEWIRVNQP